MLLHLSVVLIGFGSAAFHGTLQFMCEMILPVQSRQPASHEAEKACLFSSKEGLLLTPASACGPRGCSPQQGDETPMILAILIWVYTLYSERLASDAHRVVFAGRFPQGPQLVGKLRVSASLAHRARAMR